VVTDPVVIGLALALPGASLAFGCWQRAWPAVTLLDALMTWSGVFPWRGPDALRLMPSIRSLRPPLLDSLPSPAR